MCKHPHLVYRPNPQVSVSRNNGSSDGSFCAVSSLQWQLVCFGLPVHLKPEAATCLECCFLPHKSPPENGSRHAVTEGASLVNNWCPDWLQIAFLAYRSVLRLAPSYFTELVSLQIPRRSGIQSETDALKLIVVPSARKKSVVGVLLRVVHLEFGTTSSSLWGLSLRFPLFEHNSIQPL
jgi:hypothetical protein